MGWQDKVRADLSKVSGRQAAMFRARAWTKGLRSELDLLEWLEFDSGLDLEVRRVEDIPLALFDDVLKELDVLEDGSDHFPAQT